MNNKHKLYSADEVLHVLRNADLSDIDDKIIAAKNERDSNNWEKIHDFALQQQQYELVFEKQFNGYVDNAD